MLTWDEARECVKTAFKEGPQGFERDLAEHTSQNVYEELITDHMDLHGHDVDKTAIFMTGVSIGWYLAKQAFSGDEDA